MENKLAIHKMKSLHACIACKKKAKFANQNYVTYKKILKVENSGIFITNSEALADFFFSHNLQITSRYLSHGS